MAFLVWTLLSLSAVYWALQLGARPLAAPPGTRPMSGQGVAAADLTRLFGTPAATVATPVPVASSRYQLLGVVAPRSSRAAEAGEGVALIAVDGLPRTVRIGATLEEGLQLLAVNARSARLGRDGVATVTLQLASPSTPATGALVPAAASPVNLGGAAGVVMPPQPMPQPGQLPQQIQQQMRQLPQQAPQQQGTPPQVDNQGNPLN